MSRAHDLLPQDEFARVVDVYGLADVNGMAAMMGLSHRTVMVYAAAEA